MGKGEARSSSYAVGYKSPDIHSSLSIIMKKIMRITNQLQLSFSFSFVTSLLVFSVEVLSDCDREMKALNFR